MTRSQVVVSTPRGSLQLPGLARLWNQIETWLEKGCNRRELEEKIDGQHYAICSRELVDVLIAWNVLEPAVGLPLSCAYHRASSESRVARPQNAEKEVKILLPDPSKRFENEESCELPCPTIIEMTLDDAFRRRQSARDFRRHKLPLGHLSALLYWTYGAVESRTASLKVREVLSAKSSEASEFQRVRRATPSGGGLYPLEVYPILFAVDSLENGIYHYQRDDHRLSMLRRGNFAHELEPIFAELVRLSNAAVLMVFTAIFARSAKKYGERSYRLILFEAGHAAQNLLLGAAGLELAAVPLGGFADHLLNELLGLRNVQEEAAVYAVAIGCSQELSHK